MYFHVLCTFELLLQDQDDMSPLLKAVSTTNWAGFSFSFFAINYFLCGMCLFGWWGVSTAMHTLSGLLTGSENYLASLEIFETAGSDNRKLCPWNNVYMRALKWRQKHKHYYKCINSFKSMICSFGGATIRWRIHPFSTAEAFSVNFYPVIQPRHHHYQVNNFFTVSVIASGAAHVRRMDHESGRRCLLECLYLQ